MKHKISECDKLVECVSPFVMEGDSYCERLLNAYLTSTFILKYNVPKDECLVEARKIIKMNNGLQIAKYLCQSFGPKVSFISKKVWQEFETEAYVICAIIKGCKE